MHPASHPVVIAERRWSTDDVEPGRAFEYWFETVCRNMLELEIDCPAPQHFRGHLRHTPFGPGGLAMMEAGVQNIFRTSSAIARSERPEYHLHHLRKGMLQIEQRGRVAQLRSGDCVLTDSTEPCRMTCPMPTQCLALLIPQDWLHTWLPDPRDLVGRPLVSGTGWTSTLVSAMASLSFDTLGDLALSREAVAEQIASLLALSAGPVPARSRARDKLYDRILQTMQQRCCELDLSPASVASVHGISRRYVHMLFAAEGTTFGRELLSLRLALARKMLADVRFSGLPVGEIAARCGFNDASHFARRFRQQFGHAPTAYRDRSGSTRRGT